MLRFVNESLFTFNSEEEKNDFGEYIKLSINTSASILKNYSEDENEFTPSVRTFARLISKEADYNKFNLSVSTRYPDENHSQVLFKCMPDDDKLPAYMKKDANIIVAAFPFNGVIIPIPESDQYRILKGMISVSDQYSINFHNKKYKKILYLIISPKMSLLTGENAIENIKITFDSYAYKDGDVNSSLHESMTVVIAEDSVSSIWEKEIVSSISLDEYKNVPLFKMYRKPEKPQGTYSAKPVAAAFNKARVNITPDNNKGNVNRPYKKDIAPVYKDDDYDNKPTKKNNGKNKGKSSKKSHR